MKSQVNPPRDFKQGAVARPQDSPGEKHSTDRVLQDDGPFQWMVLACSAVAFVFQACNLSSFLLTAQVMNHWCLHPDDLGNLTLAQWKKSSLPVEEDGSFSQCAMFDPLSAPKNDSTRKTVPCSTWYFDLEEHGNTIISQWSLVCDRSWLVPLASIVASGGDIIGVPILGTAADRAGRRPVVCASVVVLILTGFASALAKSFLFFAVVRAVLAASAAGLLTTLFVTLYEVSAPTKWLLYGTIHGVLAFVVAPIIMVAFSFLRLDWMVVHVVFMVPASFLVATFYMVQESPRWLLATWKIKKAEQVTLLAAKINGTPLDSTRLSFTNAARRMQGSIYDSDVPLTIALKGLLRQPKHKENAILLFYTWFALDFAYTSTTAAQHLVYNDWVPFLFMAITVLLTYAFFTGITRFGSKKLTETMSAVICVETTVLVFTYDDSNPDLISDILIVCLMISCSAAYMSLVVFTLDLFPTVFRCIGLSTAYACGMIGTVLVTLLTEVKITTIRKDILLSLIAVLTLIGALAIHRLPDTGGRTLFSFPKKTGSEGDLKQTLVASLGRRSSVAKKKSARLRDHQRNLKTGLPPSLALLAPRPISTGSQDLAHSFSPNSKLERQDQ